jgi:putative FmdB family regulatory protein
MAIYEFYCQPCHTVFNFFARRHVDQPRPKCPACGNRRLQRQVSRFAIGSGKRSEEGGEGEGPDPFAGMDEAKLEQAMMSMAGDFENLNEEDPRGMAKMMHKLFECTGMKPSGAIEEAIRRMEAGEDPDRIDEEMGDLLDAEDPFGMGPASGGIRHRLRQLAEQPKVDPELYDL